MALVTEREAGSKSWPPVLTCIQRCRGHAPRQIFFALVKLIRICEWHSLLHPLLRSSLSFLAHALWDLAFSRPPQFLEASATRRKLDEKDRALCPANASGRRRDNEMGSGSAHAGGRLGKLTEH